MIMKKTLLLLAAVFGFTYAQAQFRPGVKIGANYSNITTKNVPNANEIYKYRLGYHAGLIFNVGLGDIFSFQPEINYSQKGFAYGAAEHTIPGIDGGSITVTREGDVRYGYVDIPLLFKTDAGPLFFELGPQASILVNTGSGFTTNPNTNASNRLPTTNDLNRVDFGLAAGVGIGISGAMVGLRYNLGLNPIENNRVLNDNDLKHNVFQLYLGYMFNKEGL
jgi:hypothetical protein